MICLKKFLKEKKFYFTLMILSAIFLLPTLKVNALAGAVNVNDFNFPLSYLGVDETGTANLGFKYSGTFSAIDIYEKTKEMESYIQAKLNLYGINAYFFIWQQFNTSGGVDKPFNSSWKTKLWFVDKNYIANASMSSVASPQDAINFTRNGTSSTKSRTYVLDLTLSIAELQAYIDNLFLTFSYNSTGHTQNVWHWDKYTKEIFSYVWATNFDKTMISSAITTKISIFDELIMSTNPTQTPIYTLNDYFLTQEIQPVESDYKSDQINSIDYVIDSAGTYDMEFSFFRKEEIQSYLFDSFKTYSLYLNNGLYHWEETQNCVVDGDYVFAYTNGKYKVNVNDVICNFNDGSIKQYFKIGLNGATYYALPDIKNPPSKAYINNYGNKHIIQTYNTNNFKYINYTTSKLEWSTADTFMLSSKDIYLDIFSLDNNKFLEYTTYNYFKEKYYYSIEFGRSIKRGFWLTYNVPITSEQINEFVNFDFDFAFVPDQLYYSINIKDGTRLNEDVPIINEDNEEEIITIDPSDDIVTISYEINSLQDLFKYLNYFINDNKQIMNAITDVSGYGFNRLNEKTQMFLITTFILSLLGGVFYLIKRGG